MPPQAASAAVKLCDATRLRAVDIDQSRRLKIRQQTNRKLTLLLILQWLVGIACALVFLPSNAGEQFFVNPLAFVAVCAAACLSAVAAALAFPFHRATPFVLAISQILTASVPIFVTGGRSESYLYLFGALAISAIYRSHRILLAAMAAAWFAHFLAGFFAFSALSSGWTLTHPVWFGNAVVIAAETAFLWLAIRRTLAEMRETAEQTARFEIYEERYRSVIEDADDIIFRTDAVGRFTFVNQGFVRLLERAEENLIGRHFTEVIAPEDRRRVRNLYKKQFYRQTPSTYCEFIAESGAGNRLWLGQKVQLIRENNRVTGFQAIARDITQHVKTEQALRESETRYRAVTDSASDAIITIDDADTILFANQAAETIFGYSVRELSGAKLSRLIPAFSDVTASADLLPKSRNGKQQRQVVEAAARRKSGRDFPVEFSVGEDNVDGKQLLTVVIRDATERKRAADAVKKSEEYRNLFKHANDAIMIIEPHSETVLDVNDRACEMYGLARLDFVGKSLKEMSDDVELGEQHLARLLAAGVSSEFETVQRRSDNKPINLLINASIIEFDGQPAVLSINRDITERKRQDAALRESEYRFRTLLESTNEGLLHVDTADRIQYANEHFCEIVGYKHDELINKVWSAILLSDEDRKFMRQVNERRHRGIADRYELKMLKKNGDTVWTLVGGAPVYNADNQIVGSMGVFTDISDRKRAEEQLLHNAFHDQLTGLPNRSLFLEHLRHTIDRHQRRADANFAVLFLDFDRFKVINDSLGHMEGDKLLVQIARRLEKSLRTGDIVARLGGDEFTILLDALDESLDEPNAVAQIVERLQADLKTAFTLGEREIFISASIGVALSNQIYQKPEEMLRDADTAMYRAKAAGKARFEIFNQTMHNQANERLQLETELRHALERAEFCNYYQPIVELESNRLVGFESLVRWQHPQRGIVLPGEFIATMEETGLIVGLGIWVLRESCRQLREWQIAHSSGEQLTMSVNLSCKQFVQTDLVEKVGEILRETAINPGCLRLEITESHVMDDSETAIAIMHRLRALGVRLSIDDFGTGYSSLSYLHRLPIDYLKIDRSFVSRMLGSHENAEIVRTIVTLAKNLEIDVIAEGIELDEQAAQLRRLECKYGQGFLFARPQTAVAAAEMIASEQLVQIPTIEQQNLDSLQFIN